MEMATFFFPELDLIIGWARLKMIQILFYTQYKHVQLIKKSFVFLEIDRVFYYSSSYFICSILRFIFKKSYFNFV